MFQKMGTKGGRGKNKRKIDTAIERRDMR